MRRNISTFVKKVTNIYRNIANSIAMFVRFFIKITTVILSFILLVGIIEAFLEDNTFIALVRSLLMILLIEINNKVG